MDLLFVARETNTVQPTPAEIVDPAVSRNMLPLLPHGPLVAPLVTRQSIGVLVLDKSLDRSAARAAIGVAIQRANARGIVLLGFELGKELLGEGLLLAGGIREMHSRPMGALGNAKGPQLETLLADLCGRAGVPWAPATSRAAPAKTVVRAEGAEVQAAAFIEQQKWAEAAEVLRAGEPLGPRGTNMLGRALVALGDVDGARSAFERTLAADPMNGIAQRQMASLGIAVPPPVISAAAPKQRAFKPAPTFRIIAQDRAHVVFEIQASLKTDGTFSFPREVQNTLELKTGDEVRLQIHNKAGEQVYSGIQRIKGGSEIRDPAALSWAVSAGQQITVTATRR